MLQDDIRHSVSLALNEDLGNLDAATGDITANLIPADVTAEGTIICRDDAVFCGKAWAEEVFNQLGSHRGHPLAGRRRRSADPRGQTYMRALGAGPHPADR